MLAGVAFSLPAYGRPMVTTVETTAKVKIGQKTGKDVGSQGQKRPRPRMKTALEMRRERVKEMKQAKLQRRRRHRYLCIYVYKSVGERCAM